MGTLLSSLTTPPSPSTSLSRTPTSACALTTRPCTTSASVPSSSPPPPTATSTTFAPPACPWSAQPRPPQAWCQPYPLPPPPLLLHWVHPPHLPRVPAVPCAHRARAHPADVRRQEHDVCRRSSSRSLPHLLCPLPWPHVHQGGRRADAQRPEQELLVLRGVGPQQHQVLCLRHPPQGS